MTSRTPRTLIAGATAISLLILVLAAVSLFYLSTIRDRVETISTHHNAKIDVLHEMSRVIRERSLRMHALYFKDDPWVRDDEFLHFNALAADFIRLRDRFRTMGLTPREHEEFARVLDIIRTTAPLQRDIAARLHVGDRSGVEQLIAADLPLESGLLTVFDHLIDLVRAATQGAVQGAKADVYAAFWLLGGMTLSVLGLTLWVMLVMRRHILAAEAALFEEKELEELTLKNIIDGVIKTDAVGHILTMNPVAQQLSGWNEAEARGRSLEQVYAPRDPDSGAQSSLGDLLSQASGTLSRPLRYLQVVRPTGDRRLIEETISPIFTASGRLAHVAYIFRDVTQQKRQADRISWQASHDPLTRVLNRNGFDQALRQALRAARHSRAVHSLLYIDLDDFKSINDRFGHAAGDELLIALCRRVEGCLRKGDQIARLGGDEFAVLLKHCGTAEAHTIAEDVRKGIESLEAGHPSRTSGIAGVSIGIAALYPDAPDGWLAVEAADSACYLAKREGKNRTRLPA